MAHTAWRMRDVAAGVLGLLLLCGLLAGFLRRVRDDGGRTQCVNNAKQIVLGMHSAHDAYKKLPPVDSFYPGTDSGREGTVLYHLLPFMGGAHYNLQKNSADFPGGELTRIRGFMCPNDPTAEPAFPKSNYAPNYFVFLNNPGGSETIEGIRDGSSNTIAFSERRGICTDGGGSWSKRDWRYGAWVKNTEPFQSEIDPPDAGDNSRWHRIHTGGIVVAMCDGKVDFLAASIEPRLWRGLVLPDDGSPTER